MVESDDERERLIVLTSQGRAALQRAHPRRTYAQKEMARKLDGRIPELLEILQPIGR